MGNRLAAIAPLMGDGGTHGLGDGSGVSKAGRWVTAMGELDALNSAVGMLIAFGLPVNALDMPNLLTDIQQDLLDVAGEISLPGYLLLKGERIAALEEWLEMANSTLPRHQEFIRPRKAAPVRQAHRCLTVCRRTERTVVELAQVQSVRDPVRMYLKRLSDLFFVMARRLSMFIKTDGLLE